VKHSGGSNPPGASSQGQSNIYQKKERHMKYTGITINVSLMVRVCIVALALLGTDGVFRLQPTAHERG
jgi:hypothetical protein